MAASCCYGGYSIRQIGLTRYRSFYLFRLFCKAARVRRNIDQPRFQTLAQSASFTIAQSRRTLLFQQVTWKSPIFFERDLLNI